MAQTRKSKRSIKSTKSSHLQLRVSPEMKRNIARAARREGLDMSGWVISQLFKAQGGSWLERVATLMRTSQKRAAYAEIHDFLTGISPRDWMNVLSTRPPLETLSAFDQNYLAAMVELAAAQKGVPVPAWVCDISPLSEPAYGVSLGSLRLHLLLNSPPPFRRRNIFIDSSVGDRV